jgi:hypothetical protein
MSPLPPPPPAFWAPRARKWLNRFLANRDRAKARRIAAAGLRVEDERWRIAYHEWWHDYGWQIPADPPNVAYAKMIARRRP